MSTLVNNLQKNSGNYWQFHLIFNWILQLFWPVNGKKSTTLHLWIFSTDDNFAWLSVFVQKQSLDMPRFADVEIWNVSWINVTPPGFQCYVYMLMAPLWVIFPASVSASCAVLISTLGCSILLLDGGFLIGFLLFPAIIRLPGTLT